MTVPEVGEKETSENEAGENDVRPGEAAPTVTENPPTPGAIIPPPSVAPRLVPIPVSATAPLRRETPKVRYAGRLLLVAALLGWAFDTLCAGYALDIGFPAFTISVLGAFLSLAIREGIAVRWRNVAAMGVPIVFFAVMVAVRANPFLTFWNVAATLVMSLMFLHYSGAGRIEDINFGRFLGLPWRVFGASLFYAAPSMTSLVRDSEARQTTQTRALPVLRGLLFALPVLAVFVALLASADTIFSHLLNEAGQWLLPKDAGNRIFHLCLALGAAWLIAGGFVYALTRKEETAPDADATRRLPLGFVEAMTVLTSVSVVFVSFVAIQFLYLFGDISHVQKTFGLNYADYARRGFWELVAVATLTLTLIYNLQTFTRRETAAQNRAFNLVGTLLIGLTLILLASAARRMQMYEAEWGATQLRLYVDHFLVWLGMALCWFVVTLWRFPKRFPVGAIICGVGFLTVLNLISPDDAVVRQNFAMYERTKILDVYTLSDLSDDAVPALCETFDKLPRGKMKTDLGELLYRNNEAQQSSYRWQASHAARYRANQAIQSRQDSLRFSGLAKER